MMCSIDPFNYHIHLIRIEILHNQTPKLVRSLIQLGTYTMLNILYLSIWHVFKVFVMLDSNVTADSDIL
jgi:hypothetical protein